MTVLEWHPKNGQRKKHRKSTDVSSLLNTGFLMGERSETGGCATSPVLSVLQQTMPPDWAAGNRVPNPQEAVVRFGQEEEEAGT